MQNIAVFFGGKSCEREISIITGVMTINVMDKSRYNIYPIYIDNNQNMFTAKSLFNIDEYKKQKIKGAKRILFLNGFLYEVKGNLLFKICKIDCGLNCCHGMGGEDGVISALLNLNNIPNASPELLASAVGMDKTFTKIIAKGLNIKSVEYFRMRKIDYEKRAKTALKYIEEIIGYPVIVKPCTQGSSIGIAVADSRLRLIDGIKTAFEYDTVIIIEKFLKEKRELNCGAYMRDGDVIVSEIEEPILKSEYLSFSDKYMSGGKERSSIMPAKISKESSDLIKSYTKQLYRRLNLKGVVRVDYLLSENVVYFNEINTVPGSLAYYLFCQNLSEFKDFSTCLIEEGIRDFNEKNGLFTVNNYCLINKLEGLTGKRS